MSAEYSVGRIDLWKNTAGDFIVAIRDKVGHTIIDDTGHKEESAFMHKTPAVKQGKMLAKHYGVLLFIDKTAQ
jgi:hypothetical protein